MGMPIKVALLLDLVLNLVDYYFELVPIGGNATTQLGTLLISAVIVQEIRNTFGN